MLRESTLSRFLARCVPSKTSDCIDWSGRLNYRGYGLLGAVFAGKQGRVTYAHRIAWVLEHKEIPEGAMVLHRCDNPRCVNVDHLFLGSAKDNTADMVTKGRHPWRQGTRWQKLNAIDGERICDLRAAGCTQQQIADWFGVSRPLISMVLAGKIIHSAHLVQ